MVRLNTRDIIFIEKMPGQKSLTIYTKLKEYKGKGTLNEFEEVLKDFGFIRSHRGFIINLSRLREMVPWGDKSYLARLNGTNKEVLISRKKAPVIKSLFNVSNGKTPNTND